MYLSWIEEFTKDFSGSESGQKSINGAEFSDVCSLDKKGNFGLNSGIVSFARSLTVL